MNWNSAVSNEKEPSVDVLQRHIMEKCVSIVVIKVQKALPGVLQQWITENLTENNIAQIPLLYKKTLDVHVKENKATVDPGLWEEFQRLCENESLELCKMPLEKVSEVSQKFNGMIVEAFGVFGCFPDETQLEIIGKNKLKTLSKDIDTEFVLPATKLISEKLMKIYQEKNQTILTTHAVKIQAVTNSLKRLYSEEMKDYMKNGPMRQSLLQKFHTDIVEKCLDIFERTFTIAGKTIGKIREDGKEKLREQLEHEFYCLQEENGTRLSNWITHTERQIEQIEEECKVEIDNFRKSTIQKLTRTHIYQICQTADKLKKGMDFQYKLLLKVENQSLNTDWFDMESRFAKICIEKIFVAKHSSVEPPRRKIHEALLNMYREEMLEAARNMDRQKITNLHNDLMKECLMCCDKILPHGDSTKELQNRLDDFFKIILASDNLYSQYVERMTDVLKMHTNARGVESNPLLKYHNEIKTELKKLLEIEVRKRMGEINADVLLQQITLLENRMEEKFKTSQNLPSQRSSRIDIEEEMCAKNVDELMYVIPNIPITTAKTQEPAKIGFGSSSAISPGRRGGSLYFANQKTKHTMPRSPCPEDKFYSQ